MSTDYSTLERLPRRMTPELILWLRDHAVVTREIVTPYGRAQICDNYVIEASPEELDARRCHVQQVAAQLRQGMRH